MFITTSDSLEYAKLLLADFPVTVDLDWFDDDTVSNIVITPKVDDYDMDSVVMVMKNSGFRLVDSTDDTYFFA